MTSPLSTPADGHVKPHRRRDPQEPQEPTPVRLGALAERWDYLVRSYQGDRFCVETTHQGRQSLDMELAAIKSCGRRARVWNLHPENGEVAHDHPA